MSDRDRSIDGSILPSKSVRGEIPGRRPEWRLREGICPVGQSREEESSTFGARRDYTRNEMRYEMR